MKKTLKILVVDDDRSTSHYVAFLLRRMGHEPITVDSGEAAIAEFQSQVFDLVLMDVVMPGMGGLEAVRKIKSMSSSSWIPVIVVTGLDSDENLLEGFEAGADDYIVKPVRPAVLDIRIRAMMRIATLQHETSTIVDNVYDGIIQISRRGHILRFNLAAERIFGHLENELLGKNVSVLMPDPDRTAHDSYIENYITTGEPKIIGKGRRVQGIRKNGEIFPLHLAVTEAGTHEGIFFIGVVRDLSEEERVRAEVNYLASHDSLTGLPNRAELWKKLTERYSIKESRELPAECTLFYCDLDGFKPINDNFSHAKGDEVLVSVAEKLQAVLFVRDFIARIGGDEFVIVVDGRLSAAESVEMAERFISATQASINNLQGYALSMSVGIAFSSDYPESIAQFISAADRAMYRAKRSGKGKACVATPESDCCNEQ